MLLHSSMLGHIITAASYSLLASEVAVPRHVAITTLLRSSRSGLLVERSSLQASGAGIRFVWCSYPLSLI